MYITVRDRQHLDSSASGSSDTASSDTGSSISGPTARPVPSRRVAGTVVALGMVSLLTDISSEAVTAILPLYLTLGLGLSTVAYGFVDGLYQGVSAATRIAAGYASDRSDRPKWVAVSGYGLSALARVWLLFSTGLGLITAVVTADRIGKGIRTAPRDAMIVASSRPENLGRSFGVHRALDTLGAALGPLLAFTILWLVVDGYDFRVVLAVSLAFAVLGLAVLLLFVPDVRVRGDEPGSRREPAGSRSAQAGTSTEFRLRQAFTPGLIRLLVAVGLLSLLTVGDGFLYLALQDRSQFATYWFPMLFVGTNVAYMALAVPFGRVADRLGRVRVYLLSHGFLLAAYAAAGLAAVGPTATVMTVLLLGAFYAGTDGVLAAVAGRVVPSQARASGIASAQTVVAVARLVSSICFGVLWYLVGPSAALLCVGVLLAAAAGPAYLLLRPLMRAQATTGVPR